MTRTLASIACATGLLAAANLVLGFTVDGERFYPYHLALSLIVILLIVLVHVACVTYFAAAGRMLSQAVFIGNMDRSALDLLARCKGRTIRCVGVSMGSIVLLVASAGAVAADHAYHWWHLAAVVLAVAVNAGAFVVEFESVGRFSRESGTVFEQYTQKRQTDPPTQAPNRGSGP